MTEIAPLLVPISGEISEQSAATLHIVAKQLLAEATDIELWHEGRPGELLVRSHTLVDPAEALVHTLVQYGEPRGDKTAVRWFNPLRVQVYGLIPDGAIFELNTKTFFPYTSDREWQKGGRTETAIFGSLASAVYAEGRKRRLCA